MIQLIYISQTVKPFSSDELLSLLKTCRKNNTRQDITGVLLYYNECFIQVLEGEEKIVEQAFERIKKDPRHTNVTVLKKKYISEREFGDWSMGFEELSEKQLAELNIEGLNDFFSNKPGTRDPSLNQNLIGSLLKFFKKSYEQRKTHEELPIHQDQQSILIVCHRAIRFAVSVLAFLMVIVIFFGVADVIYVMYQKLIESPPLLLLTIPDILATFGAFLAVLIAIEIFLNISLYLRSDVIPVKLVVATALMAISRKVIVFDFKSIKPDYIFASAAVVLALGITYWLIDKKDKQDNSGS